MSIADRLKQSARRLVVMPVDGLGADAAVVYQVRRPSALDLAAAGAAEIPGLAEAAALLHKTEEERDRAERLADSQSEDQRALTLAALDEQQATNLSRVLGQLAQPETLGPLLDQVHGVLCATIEAAGMAVPGIAAGPLPLGAEPSAVCVEIGPGRWLEPLRFVRGVPGEHEVRVDDLSEVERIVLYALVRQAWTTEAAEALAPFRGRSGAAAGGRPMGASVPAAAAPDPAPAPARGRVRRDRDVGGPGGRRSNRTGGG